MGLIHTMYCVATYSIIQHHTASYSIYSIYSIIQHHTASYSVIQCHTASYSVIHCTSMLTRFVCTIFSTSTVRNTESKIGREKWSD